MQNYAEASCVLKVKPNCHACKMQTVEILGSVCGMYELDINAEEGLAQVRAVVEPNIFLKALSRTGPHAEPKWVKLRHPKMNPSYYENHGALSCPFNQTHALPGYHYPNPTMDPYHGLDSYYPGSSSHYNGLDSYYHGSGIPLSRSYAHRRHGPFHQY